jgi:sulfur carrier protein ThiS
MVLFLSVFGCANGCGGTIPAVISAVGTALDTAAAIIDYVDQVIIPDYKIVVEACNQQIAADNAKDFERGLLATCLDTVDSYEDVISIVTAISGGKSDSKTLDQARIKIDVYKKSSALTKEFLRGVGSKI